MRPSDTRSLGLLALAALAAVALLTVARADSRTDAIRPLTSFPKERIAVETRSARRHLFDAWRADTPATRAQGLMFVRDMRADQAMIFVYPSSQIVAMWMKNTLIPLDMLFVDEGGCVVTVHERAEPGSLDPIAADAPVVLVVELVGGTAKSLGIAPGDRVLRPDAGWPRAPRPCNGVR
jgi:uncharacterized membrane protein (UPF0127 family)